MTLMNAIEQFVMNNLWGLSILLMVQLTGLYFVRWCGKLVDEARESQRGAQRYYDAAIQAQTGANRMLKSYRDIVRNGETIRARSLNAIDGNSSAKDRHYDG